MTAWTPLVVHDALGVALTPSLVVLLLLTVAMFAIVYAYQPPFPQTAAVGFLPWVVVGALLTLLGGAAAYPTYLRPLVTTPGSYLLAAFVPGLAWVAILNLSVARSAQPPFHHYLGVMGLGATAVLLGALLVDAGSAVLPGLVAVFVVFNVALLSTGLISMTIWFWSPDFVDYTQVVGGFAIFGALVHGISTAAAVAVEGGAGMAYVLVSGAVRRALELAAPGGLAGVGGTHLAVVAFLVLNVAVGIHLATQLAPYADRSPRAVNAMLGLVGIGGVAIGVNRLLVVLVVT